MGQELKNVITVRGDVLTYVAKVFFQEWKIEN